MSTTLKHSPSVSPVPKHEGGQGLAPLQTDTAANNLNSNPPSAVPSSAVTESGNDSSAGPIRRKPSRRANTAERRATHNAVERQRRETLNGRFLDLAGMLPNLQSVRRPSKSAIVNSSIALIHQQRRARGVAARELRILKSEADLLRREVNEWRERARMPPAEEPIRSQDFHILMTVEEVEENDEERAAYAAMNAVDEADEDEYDQDELSDRPTSAGRGANQGMQSYGHNMGHGMPMPMGMMPMGMGGMGGMGMQMPPQRGYPPQHQQPHPSHQYGASQQQMGLDFSSAPTMFDSGQDKTAAWTQQQQQQTQQQQQQQQMINMMQNQNQQMQAQQWQQAQLTQPNASMTMFTPPGSSHGSSVPTATTPPASNPLVQQAQQAFLANYQRNAQVLFPGAGASIPTLSGMGFQAPSTQAITPPSSVHDGDAGVSVSAPMVTDGMNSVHSSPSGSIRSGSASIHSRASPDGHFSLSPSAPVTTANVNIGMSAAVPFIPSHTRRTSSGGLAVPQPAPAMGTTVGMPWLPSNLNMSVGVGGGYAASGLSLFA
ncbi:hypothetical protein CALCODRAFT_488138 [Calocera cornea HHB12733]|uniref:BHLH domain-containing protein n=1 Tax=Calocera cornea HHB12733 TaxID=1353952 RepID=A0A165CPR7_9BASI|nr:hypothetical protein CALCODRAFT_488138 [Calocera cornea HHB12733]